MLRLGLLMAIVCYCELSSHTFQFDVCGFVEHAGRLQPWQERELAMAAIADAVPFQPFRQNRFWIVLIFFNHCLPAYP